MADPAVLPPGQEIDLPLRRFGGAHAHRAIHTGAMELAEHRHDGPSIALHLLGRYVERNEAGSTTVAGPAAVFHGAGAAHAESFGWMGAEVVIIHFDPAWLAGAGGRIDVRRPRCWSAGRGAVAAKALAGAWLDGRFTEQALARRTAAFLNAAAEFDLPPAAPPWVDEVLARMDQMDLPSSTALAREFGMNRAWLTRAFRQGVGEGLRAAVLRRRVERAAALLRSSDMPLVEVALEVGFCDQSHMNRGVRLLTGRSPSEVRRQARREEASAGD